MKNPSSKKDVRVSSQGPAFVQHLLGPQRTSFATNRPLPEAATPPSIPNAFGLTEKAHNWVAVKELKLSYYNKEAYHVLNTHNIVTQIEFLDSNPDKGSRGLGGLTGEISGSGAPPSTLNHKIQNVCSKKTMPSSKRRPWAKMWENTVKV